MDEISVSRRWSSGKIAGCIILAIVVIAAVWFVSTYNTLIKLRENVKTQLAQVEVQYQRRFDLIPNLVNSVEGIFEQERTVFTALAEARTRYAGTSAGTSERIAAINQLETALSRLLVIVENYPQLRSAENVTQLMDELAGTENRIAVERSRYNETVNVFNKKIQLFPTNFVASVFGFTGYERFGAIEEASVPPQVKFEVK